MKQTKVLTTVSLILILTLVPFTGCSTAPTLTGVTYSFAEDGSPSAMLDFTSTSMGRFSKDYSYVGFINYNGAGRPKPEGNTYWKREIAFPAEEPLPLTVRAQYTAATPMLDVAGAIMGLFDGMGDVGYGAILLFPLLAVPVAFLALALVIDLPMALAMNFNKEAAFDCPPLEADRTYALRLERKKPRRLSLVDVGADTVVYEQEF